MVIFIIILVIILLLFIIGTISEYNDAPSETSIKIMDDSSDSFYKGSGFGDLTFLKKN